MYIVCAPDSFKGSMTAGQAAAAMAEGINDAINGATIIELPIADGGEGFTDAVAIATGAGMVPVEVADQRGTMHTSGYAIGSDATGRFAVLDVASTSGLERVPPEQRDVLNYDSRGLGQLITAALDHGVQRLVIGIGGSSTNEGGAGMLSALGVRFLDASGSELPPTPAGLRPLARVDATGLDARLAEVRVEVACDVTNPLLGPEGASAVYGPQKGATTPELVAELDAILARLVRTCGPGAARVAELPGSGAAGGLGWALQYFCGASLRPGLELVADVVGLDAHLARADLLLTAEGAIDQQTRHGKAIQRLCQHAADADVPVLVFAGRVDLAPSQLPGRVLDIVAITPPGTPLEVALREGQVNLRRAVAHSVAAASW
ncbi:MAG: glycerate kinase [Brooklawnia sp.]|jgi:glycerate kinase